jgi:hypothetical protein
MPRHFALRTVALLLLTAGYGWAGGHYIPSNAPAWAYLFQFVMLLLLVTFAVGFLRLASRNPALTPARRNPYAIALNVYAALTLVVNVANIIRGSANDGPFGSHNKFADLAPIGLIVAGDAIWLITAAGGGWKTTPKRMAV